LFVVYFSWKLSTPILTLKNVSFTGYKIVISGIGVVSEFAGLTVSKVRHDTAIIRIRNNAKVLPTLPMLTISIIKTIKAYSYKCLTNACL
jgi:hypothetical protein